MCDGRFFFYGRCSTEFPPRPGTLTTEIAFTGPASVVALFRDALDDPIFARDGWRCTVTGCTGRRSLHDHHVLWRSHGGGNAQDNRTAVCPGHHLHGIHRHTIRAWGEAPHAIHRELGIRPNGTPLSSYVGDRLCATEHRT